MSKARAADASRPRLKIKKPSLGGRPLWYPVQQGDIKGHSSGDVMLLWFLIFRLSRITPPFGLNPPLTSDRSSSEFTITLRYVKKKVAWTPGSQKTIPAATRLIVKKIRVHPAFGSFLVFS
jgi:hypothetical protein